MGAKIFNWLFTMYKGRIRFELPMMDRGLHGDVRHRRHDRRAAGVPQPTSCCTTACS